MTLLPATERLRLRRFTADDVDLLVELDSDPEVMRYLTNGVPTPEATVRDEVLPAVLATYQRSPYHGRWAAYSGGEFVGWFSLALPEDLGQADLGYRLRRAAWGRGLAAEGAGALLRYAFTDTPIERVFATTMAVNTRSRRVMERAGLRHIRTFHPHFDDPIPGTEFGEVEYALTRREWSARRRP